ncbi:MAG TPA: LapA family protein [Firmicutes bacterium]|nr:LapA family protein [Bacillota bacterium]
MFVLVVGILCALLVAVFAVQNSVPVTVSFLTWRFEMSLVLIILGAAALGAVAVFLFALVRLMKQGRLLREAQQKVKRLEDDLAKLRPVAPAAEEEKPAQPQNHGKATLE